MTVITLGRDWHERLPECPTCPEYLRKIAGEPCDLRCIGGDGLVAYSRDIEVAGAPVRLLYVGMSYVKVALWVNTTETVVRTAAPGDDEHVEVAPDERLVASYVVLHEALDERRLGAENEKLAVLNGTRERLLVRVWRSERAPSARHPFLKVDHDPKLRQWVLRGQYTLPMAVGERDAGGAP